MTCLLLEFANKGQCGCRAAARAGSVLGCALKSRQFQMGFLRFWQVLFRSENLPNSPKLALRWALFRCSVNSVGWRFDSYQKGGTYARERRQGGGSAKGHERG